MNLSKKDTFKIVRALHDHYPKHCHEFGYCGEREYLKIAQQIIQDDQSLQWTKRVYHRCFLGRLKKDGPLDVLVILNCNSTMFRLLRSRKSKQTFLRNNEMPETFLRYI